MNSRFSEILDKRECSEYEYKSFKENFDYAVNSGIISTPVRYEKSEITLGMKPQYVEVCYRWTLLDK